MRTGPQQKGRKIEAPGGHRSHNQPSPAPVVQRSKAVPPTQGRTRNHPSVAPVPKTNIGGGTAHTYFGNSRMPVHPKLDKLGRKHDC